MSKNVNVNGVNYSGVSQIQLNTADGKTVLFKDVDEIITPSGSVTITENGTHNVSEYASAVVNVPTSGDSSGDDITEALLSGTLETYNNDTLESLCIGAFTYRNNLKTVSLPALTHIAEMAFDGCSALESVHIPNVTSVNTGTNGGAVFRGCTALREVRMPKMRHGGTQRMYYGDTALELVDEGVIATISTWRYNGCTALKTIILRNTAGVVPFVSDTNFQNTPFVGANTDCRIYVPSALVDVYKADEKWATLLANNANLFQPIEGSEYEL